MPLDDDEIRESAIVAFPFPLMPYLALRERQAV